MNSIKYLDFESAIEKYRWKNYKEFIKPAFGKGCIMDIPGFIMANFNISEGVIPQKLAEIDVESPDHLIFLLLDGFGFSTIRYSSGKYGMNYLDSFIDDSTFRLITSVFPSTTSTATLSYHTNMLPVEHRILGYNSYVPEIGSVCNMISMNPIGRKDACILDNGFDFPKISEHETIHETLDRNGVASYVYLPNAIKNTGLTKLTGRGASISGYLTISQMIAQHNNLHFHFQTQCNSGPWIFSV